jgi:hypothetical protein
VLYSSCCVTVSSPLWNFILRIRFLLEIW